MAAEILLFCLSSLAQTDKAFSTTSKEHSCLGALVYCFHNILQLKIGWHTAFEKKVIACEVSYDTRAEHLFCGIAMIPKSGNGTFPKV